MLPVTEVLVKWQFPGQVAMISLILIVLPYVYMCDMKLSSPVTNPFICIQILMYFLYALKKQKIVARVNLQTHRYFLAQYSLRAAFCFSLHCV